MGQQSKLLAYILRHRPDEFGLCLDSGGWVAVDDLLTALERTGQGMSRDTLLCIVAESDKKRFTLSEDEERIRAAQGHSIEVDLGITPSAPPEILFHGTAEASLPAILVEGLKPGTRQKVHLSLDPETARKVGQRHGRPMVLRVHAGEMHRDGGRFWQVDNGVWLADHVPPRYLQQLP